MIAAARRLRRPNLPRSLHVVNRVGGWARTCGLPVADLAEESLLRAARRRSGLGDWGEERFRAPLRLLLEDYDGDKHVTFLGRVGIRHLLIRLLINRLRIHNDLKQHPEILSGTIRRPLFVVGLSRSGTTLLHKLLSQDPAGRPLLFWETMAPSPPPGARTQGPDPRIVEAEKLVSRLHRMAPRMRAIHDIDPHGPEECLGLLNNTFVSSYRGRTPRYQQWLESIGPEEVGRAYEEYRRQLLLLQWRRGGGHWVLKAALHLLALDALVAAFPDACIVQTHRDPLRAVPSMCSLVSVGDELFYDAVDPADIGRRTLAALGRLVDRSLEARESLGPQRFHDLHYQDLVRDPIGSVRKIYRRFGYDYTPALEGCLKSYPAANAQHKHGVHRYSLEEFGLEREQLRSRFAPYCARFGIQPE